MSLDLTLQLGGDDWSLSRVNGAALWLRADPTDVALDVSNNAQTWTDRVHGYAFGQATAGNRPTYSATGGPNGTPVVAPAGSQWLSLAQSIALGPGATIIIVGELLSTSVQNTGVFCAADSGTDFSSPNGVIAWNSGSSGGLATGASSGFAGALTGNPALAMNAFHAYRVEVPATPGTATVFADGAQLTTWAVTASSATPTVWAIGTRVTSGAPAAASTSRCAIAEIFVCAAPMSTYDESRTAAYILNRYGLTL